MVTRLPPPLPQVCTELSWCLCRGDREQVDNVLAGDSVNDPRGLLLLLLTLDVKTLIALEVRVLRLILQFSTLFSLLLMFLSRSVWRLTNPVA